MLKTYRSKSKVGKFPTLTLNSLILLNAWKLQGVGIKTVDQQKLAANTAAKPDQKFMTLIFFQKVNFPRLKNRSRIFCSRLRGVFSFYRSKYENVLLLISQTAYPLNPSASIVLKNSSLSSHFRARIFSTKDGKTTKNQRQDILAPPPIRQF